MNEGREIEGLDGGGLPRPATEAQLQSLEEKDQGHNREKLSGSVDDWIREHSRTIDPETHKLPKLDADKKGIEVFHSGRDDEWRFLIKDYDNSVYRMMTDHTFNESPDEVMEFMETQERQNSL